MSETVTITHRDKVMFAEEGITKGDLVDYYDAVAPVMLPHLERRPITMERFNRGTGEKGFFQKNVARGFPTWLERVEVPKKGGTVNHPIVTDARSLRWLANQNCVTMHVWPSRTPHLERPDVCVFDLDPSTEDGSSLTRAALALRDLLAEIGLTSWIKTTGSKGYHIVVPLAKTVTWPEAAWLSHTAGTVLVRRDADHLTQEFSKADRGGRIYVDTGRNGYSATFAAAYTVRARPGAPVSAPCTWEEVERGTVTPRSITLQTMPQRISSVGDVWEDLLAGGQPLKKAIAALKQIAQD